MRHIEDDDMVLHFYGEGDDLRAVESHLDECADCRKRFAALSNDMAEVALMPVPERGDDYGARVWARLQPELETIVVRRETWWRRAIAAPMPWPRLALAGGLATLVVAAFVAGRFWQVPPVPETVTAGTSPAVVRERILLVAVGEHLERSRFVLAELSNRTDTDGTDLSAEQATAQDLVAASRLYRQAAAGSDPAIASVLEELERTLVEIANGPSHASSDDLAGLRERIESQGLLFKVTVLGSQVRQRQQDAVAAPAARPRAST